MESFAFIGTRQPKALPRSWNQLFTLAAEYAVELGAVVHSGGAPGAEQVAAERALQAGGNVRLYLPRDGFEAEWLARVTREHKAQIETLYFDPEVHQEWVDAVHAWHPAGTFLARASLAIYARSYGMVRHASAVVALPFVRLKNGTSDRGQTEQGIAIAREFEIPLYDLSVDGDRDRLRALMGV
ncbi:MAG: hypothetical protein K0Q72_4935 [Armatimonadetes bacterium]|jgi:hypothetical protein|nr:hypothetical protein [Armatimonadota bacterium]